MIRQCKGWSLLVMNMNSPKSGDLINHWSINWDQFEDLVSDMCLPGSVEVSWSLTREATCSNSFNEKYICQWFYWIQWKFWENSIERYNILYHNKSLLYFLSHKKYSEKFQWKYIICNTLPGVLDTHAVGFWQETQLSITIRILLKDKLVEGNLLLVRI